MADKIWLFFKRLVRFVNASSGFPNWACCQLRDHRDGASIFALLSNASPTASSVVSPIIVMLKSHLLEQSEYVHRL
jgi:hypothetical protein